MLGKALLKSLTLCVLMMFYLHACLCSTCMQCSKQTEDGQGLQQLMLGIFVSYHVGAGVKPWSLGRTASVHNCCSISPVSPKNVFKNDGGLRGIAQ